MEAKFNTLVLSDLHLGEDLSPSATQATRYNMNIVEQQLVGFVRHYARRRHDGRPWRIVFNGDLVDFVAVTLLPDADTDATHEERTFGLGRTPATARKRLELVARRYQGFFRALARFLSRGNCVAIVSGNHDTEFHWPTTQTAFREQVANAWLSMPESQRSGAVGCDEITAAISFHPWFFYDEQTVWIEHGHQYDECCSLDHQLHPRKPNSNEIALNVDAAGMRYVANYFPEAEANIQETWSFLGYIRWCLGLGLRKSLRLAGAYYALAASLLSVWRAHSRTRCREEVEEAHAERLQALAERWSLSETTLFRLDDLRRRPVVGQFRKLLAVLMLDKVLIYGLAAVAALIAFVVASLPVAAGTTAAALLGAKFVSAYTGRGRDIDCETELALASDGICANIDAKVVVLGHTHQPSVERSESGAVYVNTGTWVPNGRPGLLRAFTHLVVRHEDSGPAVSLCQWRDGVSHPLDVVHEPRSAPVVETVPEAGVVAIPESQAQVA